MRGADNRGVSVLVNDNVGVKADEARVPFSESNFLDNFYYSLNKNFPQTFRNLNNKEKETEQRLVDSPLHISLKGFSSIEK